MFIKELTIRNFRNFRNSKFLFTNKSVNTILGENASGKTNAFYAMRLVLDDSLPINARYLESKDFHRGLNQPKGHWIVFTFTFGGLGSSDEELVMANHAMEMETETAEGRYTFAYRPKLHIRNELFQISSNELNRDTRLQLINDYLNKIQIDKKNYEVVAFVGASTDYFFDDNNYNQVVGDFDQGLFPDPSEEDAALIGANKPAHFSLIKEVTCTYVKALRNVVGDMKYSKTNPLYRLLTHKSTEIEGADHIIESVKQLNSDISGLEQIKELSASVRGTLASAVGQTYSPSLDITSDLPEEITKLVQSLALVVEDSVGYIGTGKIEDLSLGGANLIYLALRLYEYETYQEEEDKIAHFLLIEEPEAHIHNHIQKTLFSNFHSDNTQVFISTHSTQISSVARISALNMISRKSNYSDVYWPSNDLRPEQVIGIERYLNAMRSTLLFAKSIILVEGDAEQILIPVLIKKVLGISLDEMGISLIKMDGTVFKHVSLLFNHIRIRNYCSILTDLDATYITEPTEYADQDFIDKLRNAHENGAVRYTELTEHCRGNVYLEAFYAKNTFETELIAAGNISLYKDILGRIYTQQARINELIQLLDGDISSQYYHALFLANKVGKGWFAILLADHISATTIIPNYILQALSHSLKGHKKERIFKQIMQYRLNTYDINAEEQLPNYWSESQQFFKQQYPTDPLTILLT